MISDAIASAGGLIFTNAAFGLGIGAPAGRAGLALGASLLAAGFASMSFRALTARTNAATVTHVAFGAAEARGVHRTRRAA